MNTFGSSIHKQRLARGWSLRYVAELVERSHVTVLRWERDEDVPHGLARKRLVALGLLDESIVYEADLRAEIARLSRTLVDHLNKNGTAPKDDPVYLTAGRHNH